MTAKKTFEIGQVKVMIMCDACGKAFKSSHHCKTNGARWRVNTWGITVRGRTAVMIIPVVRVEVP